MKFIYVVVLSKYNSSHTKRVSTLTNNYNSCYCSRLRWVYSGCESQTNPGDPKPVDPDILGGPNDTFIPSNPGGPNKPDDPANPGGPNKPVDPVNPGGPNKPVVDPVNPGCPNKPVVD